MKKLIVPLVLVLTSLSAVAAPAEKFSRASRPIPGEYIVILDRSIPENTVAVTADRLAAAHNGRIRRVMTSAANGFSVEMTEQQARALSRNPQVLLVEENGYLELSASVPTMNWHLDRIDQASGTDGKYTYCETGTGVTVYVVDTGVARLHSEFLKTDGTSRVLDGVNFSNDTFASTNPCGAFTGNEDIGRTYNAGHGTSVASLVAGKTVGVAKGAQIVSVKVASCPSQDGGKMVLTTEHASWGLDWIRSLNNPYRNLRPAVVNISFFNFTNDPLASSFEHVVNGLVLTDYDLASGRPRWNGIPVVTSANNKDDDACDYSPSRMSYGNPTFSPGHTISVGGTRRNDTRWDCIHTSSDTCSANDPGSNFGRCVDIYAPAHDLKAASLKSPTSYRELYQARSGTSFSSAIVTGVIARMLQRDPSLTPPQVWVQLQAQSVAITNPGDPHNVGPILFVQAPAENPCEFPLP